MFDFVWIWDNATTDACRVRKYVFKRKKSKSGDVYEIWKDGKLHLEKLPYAEFIKYAKPISEKQSGWD
jgi:hypothetical protein